MLSNIVHHRKLSNSSSNNEPTDSVLDVHSVSDHDSEDEYLRRSYSAIKDRNNNDKLDTTDQWISNFELNNHMQPYTSLLPISKRIKTSTAGHWKYIFVFTMILIFIRCALK